MKSGSQLFFALLKSEGLPLPQPEHRFCPERRWRFDYAWADYKVALEVDGGVWIQGRHSRGAGMLKDQEKFNRAAVLGWRILKTTPKNLCSAQTVSDIKECLRLDN